MTENYVPRTCYLVDLMFCDIKYCKLNAINCNANIIEQMVVLWLYYNHKSIQTRNDARVLTLS